MGAQWQLNTINVVIGSHLPLIVGIYEVVPHWENILSLLPDDDEVVKVVNHARQLDGVPFVDGYLLGLRQKFGISLDYRFLVLMVIVELVADVVGVVIVRIVLLVVIVIIGIVLLPNTRQTWIRESINSRLNIKMTSYVSLFTLDRSKNPINWL